MSDERDPILDACLDEILGGQTPPDLTPRIMQAWSMLPPALPTEAAAAPPVQGQVRQGQVQVKAATKPANSPSSKTPRVTRLVASMVVAASVIAIGLGIGFSLRPTTPPADIPHEVVQNPNAAASSPDQPGPSVLPSQTAIVESPGSSPDRNDPPEVFTPQFTPEPPFATDGDKQPFKLVINPPRVAAQDDAEVVTTIDVAIRSAWQEHDITPAPRAGDDEFANRLYRQVLGRGPTAAELQSFVASRSKDKRSQLVDALLTDEENVVDFARHWSDVWADVLVGRPGSVAVNKASRAGLRQYLGRAIQQAKPLDQVATELLTATGSGEIGSAQYNGAANFLLAHYDRKSMQATAQVARTFLGKRIQCAQCHDHPSDSSLAQSRFWELNTFLRQLGVERSGAEPNKSDAPLILTSRDFRGDGSDAEVFYETANGEVKVAYPALPGVTGLPRSGIVDEFDRRDGLAQYVAGSQDFRRAVVNRVWSNIFGYGFTSPVDDLGPHNPPSHPALLNDLADQFAAHKHDLRSLIRWMVLSEPFQLGSVPGVNLADAPELGRERWFSRSYPPAAAEPTAQESLLALAKAVSAGELGVGTTANIKPSFPTPDRKKPDNTKSPLTIASQSVGQSSDFVPAMTARIVDSSMPVEQKLEHLFLVTVQRSPTNRERALVKEIAAGDVAKADRKDLLRIWWTLQRSREFGVDR